MPKAPKLLITVDSLKEEFSKLQKDDIPQFVAEVKKGTKEEQKSLLSVFTELNKKHSSMEEFVKRAEALDDKLPKYRKISANK